LIGALSSLGCSKIAYALKTGIKALGSDDSPLTPSYILKVPVTILNIPVRHVHHEDHFL